MNPPVSSEPALPLWARIADGLTLVLAVAAAYVAVFGGFRFGTFFSMSTPWRALIGLTIIFGLRHYLVRTLPIHQRIWNWLRLATPRPDQIATHFRKSRQEFWTRLRVVTFPALLGPSQILLFGPWTVHTTNETEFLVSFWNLVPSWVWLLAPITAGLAAFGIVLSAGWFHRYVAALGAVGVLLWVQGNLLVFDYGLLDGSGLDLAAHAWQIPFEVGMYVVAMALATACARSVTRVAPFGSGLLMALQVAFLLLSPIASNADSTSAETGEGTGWRFPPSAIYEVSRTRNVFHIVLDMFPSHVFADIVDADRPYFNSNWSGFTFFADHLGAFRTTKGNMPTMLSGIAYRNEMSFGEFQERRANPNVFHALGQQGYRVRWLTPLSYDIPHRSHAGLDASTSYNIPQPYGSYRVYRAFSAARMLDLSLFRHAPHAWKADIYRDGQWFLQQRLVARRDLEEISERAVGDVRFLLEYAERLTLGGDAPTYNFVHLISPHLPIVADAECNYLDQPQPVNLESYMAQARCALTGVHALYDRLRALDIYDRSVIVVTSDHGLWPLRNPDDNPLRGIRSPAGDLDRIESYATPLLAIKPAGAQGPLTTSYAPTAIADLPATLFDLADLSNSLGRGTSAFALDPALPRERTYAHHTWEGANDHQSPYFDVLHLFSVNGRVTDPAAWRYKQAIFEPADDRAAQRREHRSGLAVFEMERSERARQPVYLTDEYAVFYVAPDAAGFTFNLRKAPDATSAQTVRVRIDGQFVTELKLTDDTWQAFAAPLNPRGASESPFCFELLVSPSWTDAEGERRGVLLRGDL